jgi:uncharacterized membrane protein YphA (DoxX/SURF4 family)
MEANEMATMAFGQPMLVYISGIALIAAALSIMVGKFDRLATVLLAFMLLLFVGLIHFKKAINGDQMAMISMLKDLMLAGAALLYAKNEAKDHSVIG